MSEKPTRRSLGHLLTHIEHEQKKNVTEYSTGHLNERNLYKPPRELDYCTWKSSRRPVAPLEGYSQPFDTNSLEKHLEAREAMRNFSIGTVGILPQVTQNKSLRRGTKSPVKVERDVSISSQGSYSRLDDGVVVEGMDASQTMIKNMSPNKPVLWMDSEQDSDSYHPAPLGILKHRNLANLKYKFVSNHLNSVTRKDQFRKMKDFEENVLSKSHILEKNVLSGVKAVEHLETKLQKDLQKLHHHGYGPNFHRLQVYSNIFEDLIDESPTFKYILGTIKKEYDDYISSLLDQQPSRHRLLYEQVEQLSSHGTSNPEILKNEQAKLLELQESAQALLIENHSTRRELDGERLLAENVTDQEVEQGKINTANVEPDLELADRIEEAHATILEKIDQLKELRKTLRQEFVPSTVVTHLEQCIKETEVESQRYQSQKEYFERSCNEMEKELREAIESADTTEKDSKRIWKKVNSHKRDPESDSDDGEDEDKWQWYIS